MYAKVHKIGNEIILAACGKDIVGKKFKENNIVLDVKESFYKGEIVDESKFLELLKKATIANLVGTPVDIAIKNGLIEENEDSVKKINGIKYAQIFLMD